MVINSSFVESEEGWAVMKACERRIHFRHAEREYYLVGGE